MARAVSSLIIPAQPELIDLTVECLNNTDATGNDIRKKILDFFA